MADNPYAELSTPASPSGAATPAPGMVQCSITKKWFPEDEVVTFQGQLVSAEGKQILLDRLQTGAEAPNEFVRPAIWRRFWCIFLDGVLFMFPAVALPLLLGIPLTAPFGDPVYLSRRVIEEVVLLAFSLLYFGLLHGWRGQSMGKMAGKLRVINLDGTPISKPKAFARAAAYAFANIINTFALFFGLLFHNVTICSVGVALGLIWVVADYLLALVDTRMQRSLHDRICGTRVILLNS